MQKDKAQLANFFLGLGLILMTTVTAVALWYWHQGQDDLAAAKAHTSAAVLVQKKRVRDLKQQLAATQAAAVKANKEGAPEQKSDNNENALRGIATRFTAALHSDTHDLAAKRKTLQDIATPELVNKLAPTDLTEKERAATARSIYTVNFQKNEAMLDVSNPSAATAAVYMRYTLSNDQTKTPQQYIVLLHFDGSKVASYRYYTQTDSLQGGTNNNG